MSVKNHKFLIREILRLITPEEIGEITTKHNGGKFLSLTLLVDERVEQNIYRKFYNEGDDSGKGAKILPFSNGHGKGNERNRNNNSNDDSDLSSSDELGQSREDAFDPAAINEKENLEAEEAQTNQSTDTLVTEENNLSHSEDENMSSFILIEKERFKRSQSSLKKKEVLDLYGQNAKVEVERIKESNQTAEAFGNDGVLINKKQF